MYRWLCFGDYEETLVYTTFPFADNYEIKPRSFAEFKRKENKYHELPRGGGKASEVENDSTVTGASVKDALESLGDEKLDKPTIDGSWVVNKSGSTITYTDASTFGQNISNSNLTWSADRTQNLNAKKLSFTGGRVSVPALELEITAENSVPNKIWTAGTYLWHTNNLGISYRVAYDNQVIKRISGNVTLDDSFHNCICMVTANCIITVPNTLRADFNCTFDAFGAVKATFVAETGVTINSPNGFILYLNEVCTLYKYGIGLMRLIGGLRKEII